MPVLNVESLDDPLLFDATGSFSGGMDSVAAPRLLQDVTSSELINVDIDRTGTAITRRGTASLSLAELQEGSASVQGAAYFNTLLHDKIVVAKNRKIFYFDAASGSGSWTQEGSSTLTSSSSDDVYFAQLEDKLFFCDGNSALKYFDGASVKTIPTSAGAPPKIRLIASHTSRLFAVSDIEPDTIYASDLLDAEGTSSWSVSQTIRIGGDGDPITAIFPWTGFRLLAFKRNATYVINADPSAASIADWSIEAIDRSVGCVAPKSLAQVGADVYWLALDGVRTLRRTLAGTEQEISEPISRPIDTIIQTINYNHIQKSAGFFYQNRYFLSIPTENSVSPNETIVWNTGFKSWSGRWTMAGNCFARYTKAPNDDLCFGTNDGRVLRWLGNISDNVEVAQNFTDSGVGVVTRITTREFTFGDVVSLKSLYGIDLEFYKSDANAKIDIIFDGGSSETIYSSLQTSSTSLVLPFILNANANLGSGGTKRRGRDLSGRSSFRGLQVSIESNSGKLAVRSVAVSAFMESYKPQGI